MPKGNELIWLGVGVALGYFVVPRVVARIGIMREG